MLSEVTVHMHKHTAYQTLMQQPRCWLSDPLCAAVSINRRYICCKAFYRYKEGCLILMLLLLLVASDGPSRLTKARTETGYWSVKQGLGGKKFWEKKDRRSVRKF